jgi:hypothetical protein
MKLPWIALVRSDPAERNNNTGGDDGNKKTAAAKRINVMDVLKLRDTAASEEERMFPWPATPAPKSRVRQRYRGVVPPHTSQRGDDNEDGGGNRDGLSAFASALVESAVDRERVLIAQTERSALGLNVFPFSETYRFKDFQLLDVRACPTLPYTYTCRKQSTARARR